MRYLGDVINVHNNLTYLLLMSSSFTNLTGSIFEVAILFRNPNMLSFKVNADTKGVIVY